MVEYRKIIINNYTEEEHESDVFNAVLDMLWLPESRENFSKESCGLAELYCEARFGHKEVEIDVYDYQNAPKYED